MRSLATALGTARISRRSSSARGRAASSQVFPAPSGNSLRRTATHAPHKYSAFGTRAATSLDVSHRLVHRQWISLGHRILPRRCTYTGAREVGPVPPGAAPGEVRTVAPASGRGTRGRPTFRGHEPPLGTAARDGRVAGGRRQPLPWIGSLNDEEAGAAHAGEAMGEENIPTEQPEAGQAPRVPSPDVDLGRPGDPVRPSPQGAGQAVGLIWSVRDRATFQALRRSACPSPSGADHGSVGAR